MRLFDELLFTVKYDKSSHYKENIAALEMDKKYLYLHNLNQNICQCCQFNAHLSYKFSFLDTISTFSAGTDLDVRI